MTNAKWFKRFTRLLVGLLLGFVFLCLVPTSAFSQRSGSLHEMCRQINTDATSGLVAYYAPGRNPIETPNGETDGPDAGSAVYLTNYPPEISADGNYVRIWFKSLDPNYKQGWISRRFDGNRFDSLKRGSDRWRILNCAE